jgi:hypothetical protein
MYLQAGKTQSLWQYPTKAQGLCLAPCFDLYIQCTHVQRADEAQGVANMTTTHKTTAQLKAGDIVHAHGGVFRITHDALEANSFRPQADRLVEAHGPSDTAYAKSVCIAGECGQYFYPGSDWTFQGNQIGRWTVEA